MKWIVALCLCVVGCTEQPPPVTGNPGSGVGAGGGGTGGSSGVDGGIDAAVDGGEPKGACDNESDLEAVDGVGGDVRDIARTCGSPDNPSSLCSLIFDSLRYERCIRDCVEDDVPGLSTTCAACYGALERCGLDSLCRSQCQFDGCSALCLSCLDLAGCIAEFEECTGILGDGCPDTSP